MYLFCFSFLEVFEILFLWVHLLHPFIFHSVLPLSLPIPERKHQRQCHHSTTGQPREKQAQSSRSWFKQGIPRNQHLITKLNGHFILNSSFDTIHLAPSSWEICYSQLVSDLGGWRWYLAATQWTFSSASPLHYCFISQGENKKKADSSCVEQETCIPLLHWHQAMTTALAPKPLPARAS